MSALAAAVFVLALAPGCFDSASEIEATKILKAANLGATNCNLINKCEDIALINCQSEVDGPLFYVNFTTNKLIQCCGGCCDTDEVNKNGTTCMQCPPKEWTCS